MFNIRSFVGNQVDRFSAPKNLLVDKFRQTVDHIKLPFANLPVHSQERLDGSSSHESSTYPLPPSESSSSSSVSSTDPSNHHLFASLLPMARSPQPPPSPNSQKTPLRPMSGTTTTGSSSSPMSSPKLLSNFKTLTDRFSRRQSVLRRHVSESNPSEDSSNQVLPTNDDKSFSQPIYHNNPPVDVHLSSHENQQEMNKSSEPPSFLGRSRSLIRQSTDTTCTFPIRRGMRRMESIETVEIPGLNGVKAIRYLNDNLGKLQPDLYTKPTCQNDPTYGYGKITFTVHYNLSSNTLIVTLISVDNLPFRDVNSKIPPDPFLKILLLPDRRRKYQSKVCKRTQSTCINETFQFAINFDELRRRVLLISVYDFGRSSKRSLIGSVRIDDLTSLPELTSHDVTCIKSIVPGTEVNQLN